MNYDTVYRDLDLIARWSPDLVILDEAQRIKNWSTRTARSVKRIQSPYAIVLTGTPLENRLEELVSIVQFVDRFRLGPTFKLLHNHQQRDDFGKVIGYRDLDQIGKTLEPILLRRQKDQVLDQLPGRLDSNVFVPMTPLQMKHHNENLEIVGHDRAKVAQVRLPDRDGPAAADDRAAADAHVVRQQLPRRSPHRPRRQGGRGGDAAGGDPRRSGDQGGHLQPVAADARTAGAPCQGAGLGSRRLPRQRAGAEAQGPDRPLPRRSRIVGCSSRRTQAGRG